jgi:hypothetical protein
MLTNMHVSPAEGNFCDESKNALKPAIVEDYNRHMGYVDKSDNDQQIQHQLAYVEMDEKAVFHLLDLTILNSHILLKSCGSKLSHRDFRLTLVRNMVEYARPQPRPLKPVVVACPYKKDAEFRRSAKRVMLVCVYQDASKTTTQRHSSRW